MSAGGNRGNRRIGILASFAVFASFAAVACSGSNGTPRIVYWTDSPTPATATPAATSTPTATPSETATPTPSPTLSPSPAPTAIVGSVLVTSNASDGRWTLTFHKPVVSGIPSATAATINASINVKVNALIHDFNGSSLPIPASGDGPSTFDGNFTVALASPTLLSLRLTVDQYITGAAHPSHVAASVNFAVASGSAIALPDLFTNTPAALSVLSLRSRTLLVTELGASEAATINGGTAAVLTNFDEAWAFTTGGLELTFQEYSVGPYADGSPNIVIAWSDLAANIRRGGPAGEFLP